MHEERGFDWRENWTRASELWQPTLPLSQYLKPKGKLANWSNIGCGASFYPSHVKNLVRDGMTGRRAEKDPKIVCKLFKTIKNTKDNIAKDTDHANKRFVEVYLFYSVLGIFVRYRTVTQQKLFREGLLPRTFQCVSSAVCAYKHNGQMYAATKKWHKDATDHNTTHNNKNDPQRLCKIHRERRGLQAQDGDSVTHGLQASLLMGGGLSTALQRNAFQTIYIMYGGRELAEASALR